MPASWVDLRDLAKSLAESDECSEIEARCSVSRAYYAAFHALEPLCRCVPSDEAPDHGLSGLGHRQIRPRLNSFGALAKEYKGLSTAVMAARLQANVYRQALLARREADYDLSATFDAETAKLQLLRVSELLTFAVQTRTAFERVGVPFGTSVQGAAP